MKKIKNKINNMSKSDIWSISLWILTFLLLMTVIVIASIKNKFTKIDYANCITSIVIAFTISLFSSLIYMVIVKYLKKRKNDKN